MESFEWPEVEAIMFIQPFISEAAEGLPRQKDSKGCALYWATNGAEETSGSSCRILRIKQVLLARNWIFFLMKYFKTILFYF